MSRLFSYHLRLALGSLRRDLRLSVAMFVCLGLGAGMWTMVVCHYLREYPPRAAIAAGLHQVELAHPRALALDRGTPAEQSSWHSRTRVTFPEYLTLAASGIPARQTGMTRAQVLVAAEGEGASDAAQVASARFVGADFFPLFQIPLDHGRAFSRDEEARGDTAVVIGARLNQRLYGGGDSVGRVLLVEGRPFRVAGVVDGDQPYRPEWDVVFTGKDQDALYLPLSWARPLGAWPEHAVLQSPLANDGGGHGHGDGDGIWRSDAVFVSFWAELPTAASRAAYARYLAAHIDARTSWRLRSYAEWRQAFPPPATDIWFFTILIAIGLLGAAFSTARLLLAKGVVRRHEIGIHRALGASRRALFARQMLEAALVALPAAVAGLAYAALLHAVYNRVVLENDIPVRLGAIEALLGVGPAFAVGLLAAIYPAWRLSRTPPTPHLGRA